MAPAAASNLLSPAELDYLHSSLLLTPPIRPDSRLSTQFRPLIAETDILQGTNGSARICFPDGTEAIVGIKGEVEKTSRRGDPSAADDNAIATDDVQREEKNEGSKFIPLRPLRRGNKNWVEMTIEIPGFRDDDPLPVFLAAMLNEALLTTGELANKLYINRRWHWKLFIDILLISPPLSYPIPLLSLTTHLALLNTKVPALKSEDDEDPLFDDDWDAAVSLYPRRSSASRASARPSVTLLVVAVGENLLFDPTKEEVSVADTLLAISLRSIPAPQQSTKDGLTSIIEILSLRTIDPPSRLTTPGLPDALNPATVAGTIEAENAAMAVKFDMDNQRGVWKPSRGGMKRSLIAKVVEMCTAKGGIGEELLAGLEAVDAH